MDRIPRAEAALLESRVNHPIPREGSVTDVSMSSLRSWIAIFVAIMCAVALLAA